MAKLIAIGNQKGGVAKTTTCLSLGACLAELRKSVLLIDLDPQANLTLSLGMQPSSLRRTVSDAILHSATMVSVSRETSVLGLDIAPANTGLAAVDKVLYRCRDYERYLKRALQEMDSDLYDYVLIDCPPSFGPLTLNALTAAELLIIPTQAEYYAERTLQNVFELLRLVRERTNSSLRYRLLVTLYDRRNKICQITLTQLRSTFPQLLFETIIEIDTKLRESPTVGKPITVYQPKTRGAQQYRALAKELMRDEG
jgi:chromosome partitioning protein